MMAILNQNSQTKSRSSRLRIPFSIWGTAFINTRDTKILELGRRGGSGHPVKCSTINAFSGAFAAKLHCGVGASGSCPDRTFDELSATFD